MFSIQFFSLLSFLFYASFSFVIISSVTSIAMKYKQGRLSVSDAPVNDVAPLKDDRNKVLVDEVTPLKDDNNQVVLDDAIFVENFVCDVAELANPKDSTVTSIAMKYKQDRPSVVCDAPMNDVAPLKDDCNKVLVDEVTPLKDDSNQVVLDDAIFVENFVCDVAELANPNDSTVTQEPLCVEQPINDTYAPLNDIVIEDADRVAFEDLLWDLAQVSIHYTADVEPLSVEQPTTAPVDGIDADGVSIGKLLMDPTLISGHDHSGNVEPQEPLYVEYTANAPVDGIVIGDADRVAFEKLLMDPTLISVHHITGEPNTNEQNLEELEFDPALIALAHTYLMESGQAPLSMEEDNCQGDMLDDGTDDQGDVAPSEKSSSQSRTGFKLLPLIMFAVLLIIAVFMMKRFLDGSVGHTYGNKFALPPAFEGAEKYQQKCGGFWGMPCDGYWQEMKPIAAHPQLAAGDDA
ncbi:uncharacterized protein SPPG_01073 [Spizellomyces punctatus DAOM BR117]|uniref:Uncharacterized protein n=1 Tax=Spizellomyces punctatus (strain DAOM BR117) TaxID=645134 RepID=A0A0L0HRC7_SPIPD|nr:uncharacterized protein SPPG_01073 [Spizellomyces punctatus DAOM BR117]KND03598.1 hypothetical protein SPPG_01073 [Spizellomyces punctatus DAOM BR117]|eukprot:XP_016611637.1 hypothetical protein SPPG_01073 [Spizellomyces punctatus DAOM BR117]